MLLGNEVLCSYNRISTCRTDILIYVIGAGCYCSSVDDVFNLTLNCAVVLHSAVACGSRVDIRVQQSFVVSVDDSLNIRDTTTRNFDGFSVEYFAVGVVGAKVLV